MSTRQPHALLFAIAAILLVAAPLGAQEGALRGRVTDSAGVAIADADVAVVALHLLTRTDAQGRFTFSKVARGEHEISVRKIGYAAMTVKGIVGDLEYSHDIVMAAQAADLEAVSVNASETRLRLGIEEFYRRRARGMGGTFFTREEIVARNAHRTTDVLRNSPSLRIVGRGVRFTGSGTAPRGCIPTIWLDGQPVEGMEIDNIPVTDIEGMELYSGPATTPMQFANRSSRMDCGTIVIWTRIPGRP